MTAVFLDTVVRSRAKTIKVPIVSGDTNHRNIQSPRFIIACSAGKIFLYARSPVAPKNTSASECVWSIVFLSYQDDHVRCRGCKLRRRLQSHWISLSDITQIECYFLTLFSYISSFCSR